MSGSWSQRISFRIHQWLGLASALVLLIVGATGALLALEDEITAMLPGPTVAVSGPVLPMPQLSRQLALPGKTLQRIYLEAEPQYPGRAQYQDRQTQQREWRIFNPYNGKILGPLPAVSNFFDDVMALHRWLLLPHSVGSVITGTAALMAIGLLLAGFIRRAPDRLTNIKDWLWWKRGSKGRLALWQFHALIGTWLFIPIFIMALTGPWFAFDWYKNGVKQWLGSPQPTAVADVAVTPNADAVWHNFLSIKPDGHFARWYFPAQATGNVRIRYLEADAPHPQAFSVLIFDAAGKLLQQQRYSDLHGGDYLLANIYALHTGLFFGLTGKLLWSLAGLAFSSFAVTGVWLFFNRRARPKEQASGSAETLIAYASQSGTAAAHGQRLKNWLEQQGAGVHLRSLANMQPQDLGAYRQVLVLASTYGEGQAPDSAIAFQHQLATTALALNHVNVAVLAFGDRQYQHFCAFGHWLAQRFSELGAGTLLPLQEVDRGAELALQQWNAALAQKLHLEPSSLALDSWQQATLTEHRCLNPDSGREVYHLEFKVDGNWQAGDILELLPLWSEAKSREYLRQIGLDADAMVSTHTGVMPLWQAQAQCLEALSITQHSLSPQQYVSAAAALAPRSYSIASIDSQVQLMVRRVAGADGWEGRASGALATADVGSNWQVRLKPHSNFHLPQADVPLILVGAGTGLAPYLGFLQQRRKLNYQTPVWLLFGERYAELDNYYAAELTGFVDAGVISHLDFAWSRPQGRYVQQCLQAEAARLQQYLASGAHIYVCGAIDGIGAGVQQVLLQILGDNLLDELQRQGRYHRDLY